MIVLENRIELLVPLVPPSINSVGRHWGWKLKQSKLWSGYLIMHKLDNPKFNFSPEIKRWVGVTFYWPKGKQGKRLRLPDDDNLIAGFKPARDLLKKCGYIREDNSQWAEFEYALYPATDANYEAMSPLNRAGNGDYMRTGWTILVVEDV